MSRIFCFYCNVCITLNTAVAAGLMNVNAPSLFRGLLTTYCLTSSSLDRLKSLRILLALLGPRRRGTVLSVSPGMSFSPEHSGGRENKSDVHYVVLLAEHVLQKTTDTQVWAQTSYQSKKFTVNLQYLIRTMGHPWSNCTSIFKAVEETRHFHYKHENKQFLNMQF